MPIREEYTEYPIFESSLRGFLRKSRRVFSFDI